MKTKLLQFGLLGLMFAAVIVGFSNSRPAKKISPSVYSFFYYPKPNIYYNRNTREYAYINPEGNWQTSNNLPYAVSLESEKKVTLTGGYAEIWKNNEQHRMVYAASLYAAASDLKPPLIKTPRPETPTAPKVLSEKKEDEKKEAGLKRFFRKIFKKKKDNSSDTILTN